MRLTPPRAVVRAVAAALLLACAPAFAEDAPPRPDDSAAAVEQARRLLGAGRPAAALDVLRPVAEREPDDTDAWFFRGLAAAAAAGLPDGRPGAPADDAARRALRNEAIASQRHILERRPGLAGPRLELARVLFVRGRCGAEPEDLLEHLLGDDCDAAAYHFRRALAGSLPPRVAGAVSNFLAAIQLRKRVSGYFSMAVAPDSNINAATSARWFDWRGLQFRLSDEARARSGVGLIVSALGEYRHPVGARLSEDSLTRLRLGAGISRRDYGGRRFDDMTLALHAGPQILFPRGRASLLARADRRWQGGAPTGLGLGGRLEGTLRIGRRLWLDGGAEWMNRRHRSGSTADGPRRDLDLGLSYALTPAVTIGARTGWQRTRARVAPLRSTTWRVGGFVTADLPPVFGAPGFEIGLFQDLLLTRYDAPGYLLVSPERRRDRLSISRLTVSNDDFELFRFAPVLSLVYEGRESNIQNVFDYRRGRTELTLRRVF